MKVHGAIVVLGSTVILVGAGLTRLPDVVARVQRSGVSSSGPVHSIKVTTGPAAPGEKDCRVRSVVPETAGVYPLDTVTLNVENGCEAAATVVISDVKLVEPAEGAARLFSAKEIWPRAVTVPAHDRGHLELTVVEEESKENQVFEYRVAVKGAEPNWIRGIIHRCRQPPCPSG